MDFWLYNTSKSFKKENDFEINTFLRYDYGTILKVDFGVNVGAELSGPHFAIVLEKYDSAKSGVITVLPLSSQNKPRYLALGELIEKSFTKRIDYHLTRIEKEMKEQKLKKSKTSTQAVEKLAKEVVLLREMLDYYNKYAKSSYACLNQIATISKKKIIKPKNKFDIISRSKCDKDTMIAISKAIAKKFINLKIEE